MNLIFKKFQEINLNPSISIGGSWNISIVRDNGSEIFPFGKSMKKNMILNQGLDILASNSYYTSYAGLNWNTIPAFLLGDAVVGADSGMPLNPADTNLANQLQTSYITIPGQCKMTDNYSNGSRTFSKVYDFPKGNTQGLKIREIGVRTKFGFEINGQNVLFSKFVLPQAISIGSEEWVRLFYDFTIKSDAIVNPISINLSSGTIDANGKLKLCGNYHDLFGDFDSNGNPFIRFGDSPQSSFMPYCDKFCVQDNCQTECVGTSYLVANIFIPTSPGSSIISEWTGERTDEDDGSLIPSAYTNGSFYRDTTYIFKKGNPFQDKEFQAFLFTVRKSDRNNTIAGWLWELNNKQIKLKEKEIVIQIRQSMSRIDTPDSLEWDY